jgi:hypothetical protein
VLLIVPGNEDRMMWVEVLETVFNYKGFAGPFVA